MDQEISEQESNDSQTHRDSRLSTINENKLQRLVDVMWGHMCALTALKQSIDTWDSLLIHLILDKFNLQKVGVGTRGS